MTRSHSPDRSLLRNTLWRFGQIMASGGFSAVFALITTTNLDKAEFGAYGLAITISQLFQIAANFGLRHAINRHVARARGARRPDSIRAYIRAGFLASVAFSSASVLVGLACTPWLATLFSDRVDTLPILLLVAALYGTNGISLFLQGALEGLNAFRRVMLITIAMNVLHLVLLVGLLFLHFELLSVLAIEAGAAACGALLFGDRLLALYRGLGSATAGTWTSFRQVLQLCVPIFLNTAGGFLYTKVDVLFVKGFLTFEDTASYFLMIYLFNFPLQALGAYIYVLNTEISACHGAGDFTRIRDLFWRSEKVGFLAGAGLAALFFLSSYVVVAILPDYEGASRLMRLIAPLLVIKCAAQIASGAFMVSLGRARAMMAFTLAGGAANVVLNVLLIPPYGVEGAVYSTILGHSLNAIATLAYVIVTLRRLQRERT